MATAFSRMPVENPRARKTFGRLAGWFSRFPGPFSPTGKTYQTTRRQKPINLASAARSASFL